MIIVGDLPVAWRSFALSAGMEAPAILSAARTLRTQHQYYGIESTLDYVMIHGRGDLHAHLQDEQLASDLGTRVLWYDGPALDGAGAAFGLALGCLSQDRRAFDLSRSLKARAPVKEIIPWGELGLTAGLIAGMGLVMGAHVMKLDDSCVTWRAKNSQHACLASGDPVRLEKQRKAASEKLDVVRSFVDTRIRWSWYVRDLSERLPRTAEIITLSGRNPVSTGKKKKASTGSLELRGTAPLAANGGIPHDVSAFLRTLQRDPLWKRDFTSVDTEIKLPLAGKDPRPVVDFTVSCLRKHAPARSSKSTGAKKGKK